MNEPYSQWRARNSIDNLPLAARYQTADPIRWNGSMVYPMYSEQFGPEPTLLTMALLSAAPPTGLRGHGIGLSVIDGYIGLDGRQLGGVDVWGDALHGGVTFELTPTSSNALFTVTPVWVDATGAQKSWTGNYGILIEDIPDGRIALWCSVGEGPPNFANLVVGMSTAATPPAVVPPRPVAVVTQPAIRQAAPPSPGPARDTNGNHPVAASSDEPPVPAGAAERNIFVAESESIATMPHRFGEQLRSLAAATAPAVSQTNGIADVLTPADSRAPEPCAAPPCDVQRPVAPSNEPDPGYRGALYDLGVAMYSRGEEDQACGLWAQAAAAGHAAAAYDLGVVRFRRGEMDQAEHWWRTAADRRESRAMAGLAELLDRQGNHAEARMWRTCAAEEQASAADQSVSSG
ncbi:tetratricopeptide repeat protein [Nocardia sp. NPDC050710]|uniref:tetratricopeptide repeat protein n=1 Tax=Nocardia sp. NPDC050710 TaxID=3157220 RepID=UPI003403D489